MERTVQNKRRALDSPAVAASSQTYLIPETPTAHEPEGKNDWEEKGLEGCKSGSEGSSPPATIQGNSKSQGLTHEFRLD